MHLIVFCLCLVFLSLFQSTTPLPSSPKEEKPSISNLTRSTNTSPTDYAEKPFKFSTEYNPATNLAEDYSATTTIVGGLNYSSHKQLNLTAKADNSDNSTEQTPQNSTSEDINLLYDCKNRVCVRKCCQRNSLLDKSKGCVDTGFYNTTEWEPDLRTIDKEKLEVIYGFPGPPKEPKYENYVCPIHESFEFYLKDDGELHHKKTGDSFNHNFYCVEKAFDKGKYDIMSAICYERPVKSKFSIIATKFHIAGMAISAMCLLAILILHVISASKKDLQIKCTISSCVNLFFGFILNLVNMSPVVKTIKTDNCVVLAVSVQFFFLSFYFWLNIMCYEISRIVRGTMRLKSLRDLTRSEKRYFVYCFYSWGCPLVICLVTIVMQYLPEDFFSEAVRPYIIRPHIAEGRCWFKESVGAVYAYYYGIEVFLHILNACLMGHTTYLLFREKLMCLCCKREGWASTQLRTHSSTNYLQMFKQQLSIYLMYLLIWILNCISLIHSHADFWRLTDILVSLQGVFLFFIMIKPRNYTLVSQAYEKFSDMARSISTKVTSKNGYNLKEIASSSHNEESRL